MRISAMLSGAYGSSQQDLEYFFDYKHLLNFVLRDNLNSDRMYFSQTISQ